ncbi:MAG: hypothetical protein LBO04_07055 [Spirochaetaceae bacterium]|jgi:hypothetical protein|nr:hypothetical protein [Spirochaetaceae bacterium]
MVTEDKRESRMDLTFEKVWAMFQETDRKFQETDRKFQETDRQISKLGNRLGDLVEHIITPNLLEKFNRLGFRFGKIGTNVRFKDYDGNFVAEADILLEDGDTVMVVEVKTKLASADVVDHASRMERLRVYADERGDKRCLMGAVAAAIIPEGVKPFTLKNGFYVIEQAGDTIKIDVPQDFVPKRW